MNTMSSCAALQTHLASVLQALLHAAVAEMYKLVQEGTDLLLNLQDQSERGRLRERIQTEAEHKTKQFASVMEVLGNEALAKIVKLVDETQFLPELEGETFPEQRAKHPGSILNILSAGRLEEEHSYHGCGKSSEEKMGDENTDAEEGERPESPFTPAVTLKDEFGNIDVRSIVQGYMALGAAETRGGPDDPSLAGWQVLSGEKPFFCSKAFAQEKHHHRVHPRDKPYVCERCGKCFEKAAQLEAHHLRHTGEKPFSCDVCGKSFNLSQNLTRHRQTHAEKKSLTCSICNKSFSRAKALLTHQLIHTGQKPHSCSQCGRAFRHLVNLRAHELIHTDLRPHGCDVCGKTFRHSVNLKIHTRVHTGEKPFSCKECGRSFSQKSSLISHSRTHSNLRPFSCGYCKKDFNNANSLKLHERTHTGEKPYSCEFCGKSFSQGSHLHTHRRHMHAGGKQYICDKCGKRYADPRNLKLHKCVYA